MSNLQIALAIIGLLFVAGVYAFNIVQERKLRQRLERAFDGDRSDALLDVPAPVNARVEPRLSTDDEGERGVRDRDGADAAIEFIADIELVTPAGNTALRELLSQIVSFGKPARLLAWDAAGCWRVVGRDSHGGVRRLQVALQLVNRAGPVRAPQLNGFRDVVRTWAASHGGEFVMGESAPALETAQKLDVMCSDADVAIGLNLVAPSGGAFPGEKIAAAAEAAGLKLEPDGLFHWRDDNGHTLFTMENHEPEPFVSERLSLMQTSGLTLLLDVPRVADGDAVLDRMVRTGHEMAEALGGFVVDDNRVPLQAEGIARIRTQLQGIYGSMAAHDIPAGGERAQRLFA